MRHLSKCLLRFVLFFACFCLVQIEFVVNLYTPEIYQCFRNVLDLLSNMVIWGIYPKFRLVYMFHKKNKNTYAEVTGG